MLAVLGAEDRLKSLHKDGGLNSAKLTGVVVQEAYLLKKQTPTAQQVCVSTVTLLNRTNNTWQAKC